MISLSRDESADTGEILALAMERGDEGGESELPTERKKAG
jgi:hypothetical protein